MTDKDPLCCASDKLRANVDGFDAGYINALKSARTLVRALSKDDALTVLDELVAEFRPFHERQHNPTQGQVYRRPVTVGRRETSMNELPHCVKPVRELPVAQGFPGGRVSGRAV